MNPSKQVQQQQQGQKKQQQPSSPAQSQQQQRASPNSTPKSKGSNGRRPQQQQQGAGNKKQRNSPSYSKDMEFLSFQPALQDCFVTPQEKRRPSPRTGASNNVSQSAKFSTQQNGFNNSLSPVKLSSPAIAPILRQGANTNSSSGKRGSPLALFKHTPFAGAKYLDIPSSKDLPLPPAWLLDDSIAAPSSKDSSSSSSPTSMIMEPPSPTTEAAMKTAQQNGFDGRVRIHPLQLIAAVSSS